MVVPLLRARHTADVGAELLGCIRMTGTMMNKWAAAVGRALQQPQMRKMAIRTPGCGKKTRNRATKKPWMMM